MPFTLSAADLLNLELGEPFRPKPYFKGWNRLEGRVRREEFDRALRAEARDPLWFLTRQWQLLELKGDDAGSPIEARMAMQHTPLERFAARDGAPRPFPTDVPLEAVVEREPIPLDRPAVLQLVRAFDLALADEGLDDAGRAAGLAGLRAAYPFDPGDLAGVDDAEAAQLGALVDDHLFGAATFLADADPADTLATASGLSGAVLAAAQAAATAARAFRSALYHEPGPGEGVAWAPAQLEYQFSCATAPGTGQTVLAGDSYAHGRLDWFAVDEAGAGARLDGEGPEPEAPVEVALSFLPTAISFAGMPDHRYWHMEDRRVEFGSVTAHTTDVAKMLLVEFMLAYANDWCLFPYEVKVGSVCDSLGLVVRDVFGDATLVRAADTGPDEEWRRWAAFGIETRTAGDVTKPRLLMLPTTPRTMESAPIERVAFLRDEMANLCWAAELTVPSAAGIGIDGEQFALSRSVEPPLAPEPAPTASARYRLGSDAPDNWRPFAPVRVPGSLRDVRLQRAQLPGKNTDPLGKIIAGPSPYFINEEEVPRAGRIVTRSFQRTRWLDGRIVLWLGRRSMTGRGEGSSGLVFDIIEEIEPREPAD